VSQTIALFNHKGGVSKTTTTLHLGWMLAQKGKRVLLVDADPQCNLTALILGYKGIREFENFFKKNKDQNIKDGLAPAFESRPTPLKPIDCVEVPGRKGLFLLPGHIGLSEYEVTLGIAQELSGSIQTLQNLPGSISYFLSICAKKYKADYILIDLNPSLSSLNQNILMTSDHFLIPSSPDFFCVLAIDSLATILPKWFAWSDKAKSMDILKDATYPFPQKVPKFLGTIIQKYRPRNGNPTIDFDRWITEIKNAVDGKLFPQLQKNGMCFESEKYSAVNAQDGHNLALIPDFNTLIAKSQKAATPVFALTQRQMERGGAILEKTIENRDKFKKLYSELTNKIITLTS
jgi:cellulose biosynthesis protein BcsQ